MVHRPAAGVRPGHIEAVKLAKACGLVLDPLQVFALELAMAEDSSGRWAAEIFDWLIARQNGKNELALVREMFGLVILGETIVHSAHHFKTTKQSFKRLWNLIQGNPDVAERVTGRHQSALGGFNIEFRNGGTIEFLARGSAGAGRGFDAIDLLVLDEAQELKDEMVGDVMPVVAAVDNHQIWQFGTAPTEAQLFWQRKRYQGRRGMDPRTAFLEVSADPDADYDDVRQWLQANTALLYGRMSEDTIRSERGNMSDETFARERLSISPEILEGGVLPGWADVCSPDVTAEPCVFGLDCNPDRTYGGVVAADTDGRIEVVDYRPGVGWLVVRAAELWEKYRKPFAVDKTGPAAVFIPELEHRKIKLVEVPALELPRACGFLYDSVQNQTVQVRTHADLNAAVNAAVTRDLGDTWAWGRKRSDADISLLMAATLALWVAKRPGRTVNFFS